MSAYQKRQWTLPLPCNCTHRPRLKAFELRNSGGKRTEIAETRDRVMNAYLVCPDCSYTYELSIVRQLQAERHVVAMCLIGEIAQPQPLVID